MQCCAVAAQNTCSNSCQRHSASRPTPACHDPKATKPQNTSLHCSLQRLQGKGAPRRSLPTLVTQHSQVGSPWLIQVLNNTVGVKEMYCTGTRLAHPRCQPKTIQQDRATQPAAHGTCHHFAHLPKTPPQILQPKAHVDTTTCVMVATRMLLLVVANAGREDSSTHQLSSSASEGGLHSGLPASGYGVPHNTHSPTPQSDCSALFVMPCNQPPRTRPSSNKKM